MKKSILFRLFGIGGIPEKIRPALAAEGVVVADEGVSGWFVAKNVKGPGKRYFNRIEGFSGWLVITGKRILCYTYWKRQMNISVEDPRVSGLYVNLPKAEKLSIAFESAAFRDGWAGVIEFQFNTEKARQFYDALKSVGAQQGHPAEG